MNATTDKSTQHRKPDLQDRHDPEFTCSAEDDAESLREFVLFQTTR